MKMQITFRSGAQITVDVTEFRTSRSPITDRLIRLSWIAPDGATAWLHGVYDLNEVVAIVGIDTDPQPTSGMKDNDKIEIPAREMSTGPNQPTTDNPA